MAERTGGLVERGILLNTTSFPIVPNMFWGCRIVLCSGVVCELLFDGSFGMA